jgi:phosphate transport system ATP-binding protein
MTSEKAPTQAAAGDAEPSPSPVLNPDATRPQSPSSYSRFVVTDSMQLAGTNVATNEEVSEGVAIEGLTVKFRGTPLIDGISTLFEPNKVTAIVGPTGCGKTTLLRSINRMHDHVTGMQVSGSVVVEGVDIYGADVNVREVRRRVGMLFQRPNPFPRSIAENVGLAPRAHGLADRGNVRELVRENLTMVGLWDAVSHRLHGSPFGLSGGQQQLLCLARTLALSPDVILLDEPTSALDPDTTDHIESLMKKLSEHMTVLIVTHNLAQASRISDNVLFLMKGSVVEATSARTFFHDPADERSRAYVSGRIG